MSYDLPPSAFAQALPEFLLTTCKWVDGSEWERDDEFWFHFIRALRGHPRLRALSAEKALAAVRAGARKITGPWPVLLHDLESEDGQVAFYDLWERVRFPMGIDPVEAACGLAQEGMIRTHINRPGKYSRFLTVAALLQIQVRQQSILLPVRKIAHHFPCEANTVTVWIRWAREDGVLIKTRAHAFRSGGESRAAEYLLGLHLWRGPLPKLSALVGLPVGEEVLQWIEEQFQAAGAPQPWAKKGNGKGD